MNTAEHWREAEKLLGLAKGILEAATENTYQSALQSARHLVAVAQVHATLATYAGRPADRP